MTLRITFVLPHLSLSGGDKVSLCYADGLAARGHDVTVVHGPHPHLKARLHHFLFPRSSAFHRPGNRVKLIAAKGPPSQLPNFLPDADILIASWWATVEALNEAPISKGRLIHHVQDHEIFPYIAARSASVYRLPLPKIVVSRWLLEVMHDVYGARASLVLNPVDTHHFAWAKRDFTHAPPTVGTVYGSATRKNSRMAFEAVNIARQTIPELRLVCFGADRPPSGLAKSNWVDFHLKPRQADIPGLYGSARAWLFTSIEEGFGLPIIEAMAVGTPVIATRAGAASDLVTSETGVFVEPDPGEMAKEIVAFFSKPLSKWAEMSRACRLMAERHEVETAVSEFEAILLSQIS